MDDLDKIAYQKLYDLIEKHNQATEKILRSQLDALNSLKWNMRFFVVVGVIYFVLALFV